MNVQTLFRAGNSPTVVAIPSQLAREVGFKSGQKVVVEKLLDGEAVVIKKLSLSRRKTKSEAEFNRWMKKALEEDAGVLDELASR